MSKMIQLRNVLDRLHRELARRAQSRRMSLTDYIRELLKREAAGPRADEVLDRMAKRTAVRLPVSAAQLIHEERADREIS